MKLSKDQELILRTLYAYEHQDREEVNERVHDIKNYESLSDMGLLKEEKAGDTITFYLSDKGKKLIEEGGYIIKYPLASEAGTVNNYIAVLNSMEKSAAKALLKSILTTELYKKWGKQGNIELMQTLQDTMEYYESFDHPVARLDSRSNAIAKAEARLDKTLIEEMSKIEQFSLPKKINLGLNSQNEKVLLVGIIGNGLAKFEIQTKYSSAGATVTGNYLTEAKFFIPSYIKKLVIREYYMSKSKQPKKTKDS